MRRLYIQIYLAFLGVLVVFAALSALTWLLFSPRVEEHRLVHGLAAVLSELLPVGDRDSPELQRALERLSEQFGADLVLRQSDGSLLAYAGEQSAPEAGPRPMRPGPSSWRRGHRGFSLQLADGRWLVADARHRPRRGWIIAIGLLAIAIAIGAYPMARRITGRLERLQQRVDALGGGELSARVAIEGNDEVAELARSFNRAADRIERLVDAQRNTLAEASHELRTPLTRIRMAVELLGGGDRPELRQQVGRDIAELDELIDELLMASRLEARAPDESSEMIDLLALVAEEAPRVDAEVDGRPAELRGNRRMLRRLVRNLFDNARRHAAGATVDVSVDTPQEGQIVIRVLDRGPGVIESERERIFEPFYRVTGVSGDRGVGLGLALVRRIARHHGGDARCLPREGGGTCFEVTLQSVS